MSIIKNNKMQYLTFVNLQRKKNSFKDIKQGLSLDCKTLVKKVYIKNKDVDKIYSNLTTKSKSVDKFVLDKFTNNDLKNNLSSKFFQEKKRKTMRNMFSAQEKKLNFYDTVNFDLTLATKLEGYKSNKNIYVNI